MEITNDLKVEILRNTKTIESVSVLYKKKVKYDGELASVNENPFEIKILDKNEKDKEDMVHVVDFEKAVEIAVVHIDGSISVFKDLI